MKIAPTESAFPINPHNQADVELGLTKREYFAAMAMQGLLASDAEIEYYGCASMAVKHADTLIAELNKE